MEVDTDLTYECPKNTVIVDANVPGSPYKIVISNDSLDHLGAIMLSDLIHPRIVLPTKAMLVTNHALFDLYGHRAMHSLGQAGFQVCHHLVHEGEHHKTMESVERIFDTALKYKLDRSSVMVALGGGVVGDMTGFAAACWMRGIAVIQVPTSLLAMVDSAIGGKTGVNHPNGKNLIGAFHQPRMVLIDPQLLKTLPDREFRAGMAEIIKCGVILDKELFTLLEHLDALDNHVTVGELDTILYRTCKAKADVVSKDEKESGLRSLLNYGHTVGHAIESLLNYQGIIHGEAVAIGNAIGMMAAGELALELDMWEMDEVSKQQKLIEKASLPTKIPQGIKIKDILDTLKMDKKVKNGRIHFALPTKIGRGVVTDWPSVELIEEVLEKIHCHKDDVVINGHI